MPKVPQSAIDKKVARRLLESAKIALEKIQNDPLMKPGRGSDDTWELLAHEEEKAAQRRVQKYEQLAR